MITYKETITDNETGESHEVELSYKEEWIKNRCVDCDKFIPNPITNYKERGNYCGPCNAKYNKRAI